MSWEGTRVFSVHLSPLCSCTGHFSWSHFYSWGSMALPYPHISPRGGPLTYIKGWIHAYTGAPLVHTGAPSLWANPHRVLSLHNMHKRFTSFLRLAWGQICLCYSFHCGGTVPLVNYMPNFHQCQCTLPVTINYQLRILIQISKGTKF